MALGVSQKSKSQKEVFMEQQNYTAREVAIKYRIWNPGQRFAAAKDDSAVAAWHEGKWYPWVSRSIAKDFPWVLVEGKMPLINGEPPYKQTDWVEVVPGKAEADQALKLLAKNFIG